MIHTRYKTAQAALAACAASLCGTLRAGNQTTDLSPIVTGATLPFTAQIQGPVIAGDTLPSLQSFAKAQYNGEWLLMTGLTSGMHNLGRGGFSPQYQNTTVYVIDPNTHQVWSRSLASDPNSGLTQPQLDTLTVTNTEFSQIGSHLYMAGGYGQGASASTYQTYSTLTSVDIPGMMNWVKTGTGTAAGNLRQISDPMFQVTGGEMETFSNARTNLVFGQNFSTNYSGGANGIYTNQVRSFNIVDDGSGLSIANPLYGPTSADFRRRDLNVVPVIQSIHGNLVSAQVALAGVFTPTFGVWTVPVTIDADGNASEQDPAASTTFKQGMQQYKTANIGLYSAANGQMHTLLFGGISYQYVDAGTGNILADSNIPFINNSSDIVTDAAGRMTQYLLPSGFPAMTDQVSGKTLYLGTETDFFLNPGVPTYENGVINLDALTGTTLVGYFFGGIVSDAPNGGTTTASSGLFPVYITPQGVPEPASLTVIAVTGCLLLRRRRPPR